MNAYIKNYVEQAAAFFPIVGKPEQSYLSQFARSIEDYFAETEPDSMDTIIQVFGVPQKIVREYLAHSDTRSIVKRIRIRKYIRLCIMTFVSLCLMAALLFAVHLGLNLKGLHEIEEYDYPVYSADGTRIEYGNES